MPTRRTNPGRRAKPPAAGTLPAHGQSILDAVYETAKQRQLDQGASEKTAKRAASAQAWCAVKRQYFKRGKKWIKRKEPLGRDEQPPGCKPYRGGRRRNPGEWTRGKTGTDRYDNLWAEYRRGDRKAKLTFRDVWDPSEIDKSESVTVQVEGHHLEDSPDQTKFYHSEAEALADASKVADLFDDRRVTRFPARGEDWEPYLAWFKTQDPNQADYVTLFWTNDRNGAYDSLLLEPLSESEATFEETFPESDYQSNPAGYKFPPAPKTSAFKRYGDYDLAPAYAKQKSATEFLPGKKSDYDTIIVYYKGGSIAAQIDPGDFSTTLWWHEKSRFRPLGDTGHPSLEDALRYVGTFRPYPNPRDHDNDELEDEIDDDDEDESLESLSSRYYHPAYEQFGEPNPRDSSWVVVAPSNKSLWPVAPLRTMPRVEAIQRAGSGESRGEIVLRTGFDSEGQARSYADKVEHTVIEVSRPSDGTLIYRGSLLDFSNDPASSALKFVDRGRVLALVDSNVETKLGQGKKALIARRDRSGNPSPGILSDRDRKILERLADTAEATRDDWGTVTAIDGYLNDPRSELGPLDYLAAVEQGIHWNLKHYGEGDADEKSARRALERIAQARRDISRHPHDAINPYLGDAVELAQRRQYEEARARWEREGRRGPPPTPPRSRQRNPAPREATLRRRITGV